ncbi:fimbrial protein [Klebsiella sp. JN_Kp124]|uniref:fimbrial protein n=1 Tax=Klebsiella TaxID=570 RepID=UPI001158A70B|nr:fimbrial protein [Klebsiella pasteurii]VUS50595.1 S-fimbrial protein subunit SfaH [Klebsiella pasteurii]
MKYKFFLFLFSMLFFTTNACAFSCMTSSGATIPIGGGRQNVRVNLSPELNAGQNLIVDLSTQIFCRNDYPQDYTDYVSLSSGSAYGDLLSSFSGTVRYSGSSYPFPTTRESNRIIYNSSNYSAWPVQLYLTPIDTAGGVKVRNGSLIAVLNLRQRNNKNNDDFRFIWNIYANNDVVIPTGGCDVSARDVTISLPDYPGTANIPLTIRCTRNQSVAFYLSGRTTGTNNTTFANTSSSSPAEGVGVQIMRNGSILPASTNISLGTISTSSVSLGLQAKYERTSGQVKAGNVQTIIGVNFVYQ